MKLNNKSSIHFLINPFSSSYTQIPFHLNLNLLCPPFAYCRTSFSSSFLSTHKGRKLIIVEANNTLGFPNRERERERDETTSFRFRSGWVVYLFLFFFFFFFTYTHARIFHCGGFGLIFREEESSFRSVMQSQLVCSGCRSVLLYPRGAANVCCAICSTITSVPPPGMEMSQIVCGGCRTLLMYTRGATSVRCSCCHTINLARPASSQVAHVYCGQCHTMLMYPYGAPSVKCAVCHYITNIGMGNMRVPTPVQRPNGAASTVSASTSMAHNDTQTVVVENPMSVDESGKLVSNVVVGVTSGKK